ncbi:MAG: magnesium/cobalt transporter CorA [Burkholderiales bacterium]|nr:magnesium/cobalt transporter CorA [Burkholderiales bacterium]
MSATDIKKRVKKTGQQPGTLTYTGSMQDIVPTITVASYNNQEFSQYINTKINIQEIKALDNHVTWIHVHGLQNIEIVQEIAVQYKLHKLTVEDILNVSQRSKIESFDDYIFVTLKILTWDTKLNQVNTEQLSIVVGNKFIISFTESPCTAFDMVRERLQTGYGVNMLENGSDYLAYRLMDTTIDQYFVVLEKIGDRIEQIEENIILNPTQKNARDIFQLKHKLLILRKAIWPIREEISHLLQSDQKFITAFTRLYLRDLYDHVIQAIDTVETLRDMVSSIMDIYLSLVTNKMNEVMKVLTIISTIFIPITFITSLYGMNFKYMPELESHYGYPIALAFMGAITGGMILFFRRKKWI